MKFLRLILLPGVVIYSTAIYIRNFLFDKNIFKQHEINIKVISVGNITVGGSGKTPLVIYLCELLKKTGYNIGVLSRGYRRKTSGYLLVSNGEKILASVEDSGDEIFQTARTCGIPAAASENRFEGAKQFMDDVKIDTLLLDDAFQHRWIKRDINLLIFEQNFLLDSSILNQSLLPTGNMREPFSSVRRADAIILNRKFSEKREIPEKVTAHFQNKSIFTASYKAIGFIDVTKNTSYSFIRALNLFKIDTTNQLLFIDHKNYSLKEVQQIRKEFYSTNSHSVITTEKDAVKLSTFAKELDDIDIFYLKIVLKIDHEDLFINFIKNTLN